MEIECYTRQDASFKLARKTKGMVYLIYRVAHVIRPWSRDRLREYRSRHWKARTIPIEEDEKAYRSEYSKERQIPMEELEKAYRSEDLKARKIPTEEVKACRSEYWKARKIPMEEVERV